MNVDGWIRRAALVGFPAGFAAAAPFIGEMAAHVPLIAMGADMWDSHTMFFDAANAGEVGKAMGPLWIVLEILLLRAVDRGRWAPLGAAAVVAVGAAPAIHLAADLPWDYRWMPWGVGLATGLAVARALDSRSRLLWAALPALTTFAAFHAWRYSALPSVSWGTVALKPALAGAVAGLVVSVGRDQGLRWGPSSPPVRTVTGD